MKKEQIDKYLNKKVRILFFDNEIVTGFLGAGRKKYGTGWIGKGYHLTDAVGTSCNYGTLGLAASHVKKIQEL